MATNRITLTLPRKHPGDVKKTKNHQETIITPNNVGSVPAETNSVVAKYLRAKQQQQSDNPVVDARADKTVGPSLGEFVLMRKEDWDQVDESDARLYHMKKSLPLATPQVAVWFACDKSGAKFTVNAEQVPGVALQRHTLLTMLGHSSAVKDMLDNKESRTVLEASAAHEYMLDSFTVYTPPLFCLIHSTLPGILRPIPSTVNTVYLATYYLACFKVLYEAAYKDVPVRVDKQEKDEEKLKRQRERANNISTNEEAFRQALDGVKTIRVERVSQLFASAHHDGRDTLGNLRAQHRRITFSMLHILEAQLMTMMRLPGDAVHTLTAYQTHEEIPQPTAREHNENEAGRWTAINVFLSSFEPFRSFYNELRSEINRLVYMPSGMSRTVKAFVMLSNDLEATKGAVDPTLSMCQGYLERAMELHEADPDATQQDDADVVHQVQAKMANLQVTELAQTTLNRESDDGRPPSADENPPAEPESPVPVSAAAADDDYPDDEDREQEDKPQQTIPIVLERRPNIQKLRTMLPVVQKPAAAANTSSATVDSPSDDNEANR